MVLTVCGASFNLARVPLERYMRNLTLVESLGSPTSAICIMSEGVHQCPFMLLLPSYVPFLSREHVQA